LKGKRLNNLLNALAKHEKRFLDEPLPPQLFIDNNAQINAPQPETTSSNKFESMTVAR
jgi:hypothetical protein